VSEKPPEVVPQSNRIAADVRGENMKDAKDTLRIVGIILLGLFVLVVVVPFVFAVAGIAVAATIKLAILLIKVAVTLAVIYLVLTGVRALLK
jgi:hypothetical protein